jgi:hypothetical protein
LNLNQLQAGSARYHTVTTHRGSMFAIMIGTVDEICSESRVNLDCLIDIKYCLGSGQITDVDRDVSVSAPPTLANASVAIQVPQVSFISF